jgi:hypothetical protein
MAARVSVHRTAANPGHRFYAQGSLWVTWLVKITIMRTLIVEDDFVGPLLVQWFLSKYDLPSWLTMALRCAAGLDVTCADRNRNGLTIPGGAAVAFYDGVKAIFPEAIIFFPLPLNESQVFAFVDYFLARGVMFAGMSLRGLGGLSLLGGDAGCRVWQRLRRGNGPAHDPHKKRAQY